MPQLGRSPGIRGQDDFENKRPSYTAWPIQFIGGQPSVFTRPLIAKQQKARRMSGFPFLRHRFHKVFTPAVLVWPHSC
jgi:hypothetical protein